MTNSQTIRPLRPIYGRSDERWAELAAWMEANADPEKAGIETMLPTERGGWHARYVQCNVNVDVDVYTAEYEYPSFPEALATPEWATDGPFDSGIDPETEHPVVNWDHLVAEGEFVKVWRTRNDAYDPEAGVINAGAERVEVWVGGNPVDQMGWPEGLVGTPAALREFAAVLLTAARVLEEG